MKQQRGGNKLTVPQLEYLERTSRRSPDKAIRYLRKRGWPGEIERSDPYAEWLRVMIMRRVHSFQDFCVHYAESCGRRAAAKQRA